MENKILVTGATGNIGKEIIKLLKTKNANFVAGTSNGEAIEELQRSHKLWEAKIDSKLKELTDDIQKELKRMAERSDKRHARTMATASELHDFNHELNHHLLSNTKELYQLKGEASK